MEADVAKIKEAMLGNWESIAPEIRPSKNPDGSLKPFYLKRAFKYQPSDRFELEVVNSADPYGAVPFARIKIGGHMLWRGAHPIAPGAQKVEGTAWRSKPSWFIVAKKDRTVHPELERFVAKRMGATVVEADSSHVPMLSQPDLVLDVIRKAANAVQNA